MKRYYTDQTVIARQAARIAAHRTAVLQRGGIARREVREISAARTIEPLHANATDAEIQAMADRRAELMAERVGSIDRAMSPGYLLDWLNAELRAMQARPFRFRRSIPEGVQLAGFLRRVKAPEWWRRQIAREVVRRFERDAIAAGRVNARAGQWYASDETVRRRIRQNRRNAAILESTVLENEHGDGFTIKALADKSTASKPIRRGELMTRIRGCEEWAEAQQHRGVFLTLTAPSRFHQQLYSGGMNPAFRGATPREAQGWLRQTWAAARSRLDRIGVSFYGFRVAEPHHDGCPHWHALLWAPAGQIWRLVLNLRRWWLRDGGDEKGARQHRMKAVLMRGGQASGYVAKYIAKNIDDAGAVGVEGHIDGEERLKPDDGMRRELWANPAARVEAWAAAWGIRQFQALGQPPVTVWRELRRVKADALADASLRIWYGWQGAQRDGEQRACWHTFLKASGGTCTGRMHKLRVARLLVEHEGRYETSTIAKPVGVFDVDVPEVVPSTRSTWKPRVSGSRGNTSLRSSEVRKVPTGRQAPREVRKARAGVPPWTRVNNCTKFARADGSMGLGNFADVVAALVERVAMNRIGGPPTCPH